MMILKILIKINVNGRLTIEIIIAIKWFLKKCKLNSSSSSLIRINWGGGVRINEYDFFDHYY